MLNKPEMNQYTVMNILDLIDSVGENEVQKGLSDFLCPQNAEIENFIRNNAIEIKNDNISNTTRRKLSSHARLDYDTNSFTVSAFLLAQIGKNYGIDSERRITGDEPIDYANDIMADIQHRIGGGII